MNPIEQLQSYYINDRILEIDNDFLQYEETMSNPEDINLLLDTLDNNTNQLKLQNKYNSILLYVTGLTDEFDFALGRSKMIGGSPPDIDLDFDAADRYKAIEWAKEFWGKDNVAHIVTHGSLKPKSLARKFYKVTEKPDAELKDILKQIPDPKYGQEPSFEEVIAANPELKTNPKYQEFYNATTKLNNMVSSFGIHAAGIVISDFPIKDWIPTWTKKDKEMTAQGVNKTIVKTITQYDMKECEDLGMIKFDFLSIDNLSIIKQALKIIKDNKDITIDPYAIEDHDQKTYDIICQGLLTGLFQMEAGGSVKNLIHKIQPRSIEELSDVSALNRPGPMQAGSHIEYIDNKESGSAPAGMPDKLKNILSTSYWTVLYQEQVMRICSELAGFSLKEADDVRRAMGKKDKPKLALFKKQFVEGCQREELSAGFAELLWEQLEGFADYCLAGDTLIQSSRGNITIKEIIDNQWPVSVKTINPISHQMGMQEVVQFHNKGEQETFTYELENGKTITCTPDHHFMIASGEMKPIQEIFDKQLDLIIK